MPEPRGGVLLSGSPASLLVSVLLAFAVVAAAPAPHKKAPAPSKHPSIERARYLMGTICTIVAEPEDTAGAARAIGAAFDGIARLEGVLSSWREDSELARLNAAAGDSFDCSAELFAALDSAARYSALTDGSFDPTVEPLNRIWDMRGSGRVPSPLERIAARSLVGWQNLRLDAATRRATLASPGMGVDLGGIGKGVALDRAAQVLRSAGIARALLDFGGETLSLGRWNVTIAHPAERLSSVASVAAEDAAVSTSGQSEHGFEAGGKRYGHILDPRTGEPVASRASVTVNAGSATGADALSTALFVMGRERAGEFATRHPEIGVLWLEPDGKRVRAWKWNLSTAAAQPGVTLEWMN